MLQVFICEDSEKQRKNIQNIVENTIIREKYDMELVMSTNNPFEVIQYIKKNRQVGIYFLDINLNSEINGIKLAEKIREIDPSGFIIFITTHSELTLLTFEYKIEAMDFIIKGMSSNISERIARCIEKANQRYYSKNIENKFFTINTDEKIIKVKFDDILFFETSETIHKIRIHALNRHIEFYGKLKEIEEKLDNRFFRCHKSYIVNTDKIKEIDKKNRILYMVNGEECLISIKGIKQLNEKQ